jgi:hypothetical protein
MMINDHHRKQMIIGTALGALNGLGTAMTADYLVDC